MEEINTIGVKIQSAMHACLILIKIYNDMIEVKI